MFGWLKPKVSIKRVVEDGYSFEEHCTACKRETLFREVELRTSFGFGRVMGEGDRAFACKDCGHRLEDEPRTRRRGR